MTKANNESSNDSSDTRAAKKNSPQTNSLVSYANTSKSRPNKPTHNAADADGEFHTSLELMAGSISGIVSGVLLSPFDKALYFSIKHHRPLFHAANWIRPFHGLSQTLWYRSLNQTIFFPCEKMTRLTLAQLRSDGSSSSSSSSSSVTSSSSTNIENLLAGVCAGALTAVCLNPTQVIRYDSWINHTSFAHSLKNLYAGGGLKNFSKGLVATVLRDTLFGAIYSVTRHLEPNKKFDLIDEKTYDDYQYFFDGCWNAVCAWLATATSSPFNYVRSIQFATHSHTTPDTIRFIFKQVAQDMTGDMSRKQKYDYLNVRLKIGWGTARVALGMAIGSQMYSFLVYHGETD